MNKIKLLIYSMILFVYPILHSQISIAQEIDKVLKEGTFAPEFQAKDIEGNSHSIAQYKGKKILLSFNRNAGCPICNYRFHELEDSSKYFKKQNIILLSIYESAIENVQLLKDTNQWYQKLVADPEGILYSQYGVEENKGKTTKGVWHGLQHKLAIGKKKFTRPITEDGKPYRNTADFLIDENGNILIAYYSKYLGDRLPISLIRKKLQ
jgi:peroxiredoxin Q/BCP